MITWSIVEIVRHLWSEVEVLTAPAQGCSLEDHVPHSPLILLIQTLINLINTSEQYEPIRDKYVEY